MSLSPIIYIYIYRNFMGVDRPDCTYVNSPLFCHSYHNKKTPWHHRDNHWPWRQSGHHWSLPQNGCVFFFARPRGDLGCFERHQKTSKLNCPYLENLGKYHFFRQLWLVLGVKLMEINSNWFSRYFRNCLQGRCENLRLFYSILTVILGYTLVKIAMEK